MHCGGSNSLPAHQFFRGSSVVEQGAVNALVGSSSLSPGAIPWAAAARKWYDYCLKFDRAIAKRKSNRVINFLAAKRDVYEAETRKLFREHAVVAQWQSHSLPN